MNTFWDYFWPPLAVGIVIGLICGVLAWRRPKRVAALTAGALLAIALAGLWHGPLGAADRLAAPIEREAREALDHYEMFRNAAHLHRHPLTRRLILSGRADDFQSNEMVRLFSQLPGVSRATWSSQDAGPPLIVEGAGMALLGFLFGLGLAYLIELHRRYNAQWNW